MSQNRIKSADKITVPTLMKMYQRGEKITMLTAYDYTMAALLNEAGLDIILVGDSLGMVIQGHSNTLPVSIEELVYHTRCVARGITRAHLMADMPFMSYQASCDEAVKNAGLLLKEGAESVKIEGGEEIADLVWYLTKVGIPVMAHIGLKPQSIHRMGGYRVQGKSKKESDLILEEARMMEEAGAFSLLIEGVPIEVAEEVTRSVQIPTIGIGSGPHVSGQVLVVYDLLGANPSFKPRFVKSYANLHEMTQKACSEYIADVKNGCFPAEEHGVHQSLIVIKGEIKS